jgi:hypothetical protein
VKYLTGEGGGGAKVVGRGHKTTRRVRARVCAKFERPRRERAQVLTLRKKARQVRDPAHRERVLDRWFEARDSSDIILI